MAKRVGSNPDFDEGEDLTGLTKAQTGEEVKEEEKETPAEPSEVEKPAEEPKEPEAEKAEEKPEEPSEDTGEKEEAPEEDKKAVQGLTTEKEKLLADVRELRRLKRYLKEEEKPSEPEKPLTKKEVDELKDLNPTDVQVIERVIRAKGYIQKGDLDKTFFQKERDSALDEFLEQYPEYRPENDPGDKNWTALKEELAYYKMPNTKREILKVLGKAHRDVSPLLSTSDRTTQEAKKKQLTTAQTGTKAKGVEKSSQGVPFTEEQKEQLRRGGHTDEDIEEMQKLRT